MLLFVLSAGAKQREPFSKGHLHDFLLLNVDRSQNIQYDQRRFTCHDVDFTLRLHSAGMLICRFNGFSVMKKQIAIGGYITLIIKTKVSRGIWRTSAQLLWSYRARLHWHSSPRHGCVYIPLVTMSLWAESAVVGSSP